MKQIWGFLVLSWLCFFNYSAQAQLDPRPLGIKPAQFSSIPRSFWKKDFLEQLAALRYVPELQFASYHDRSAFGLYSMQHFIQFLESSPWGQEIAVTPIFLFDFREQIDFSMKLVPEKAQQFLDGHQIPSYPGITGHVVESTIANPNFAAHFKGRPLVSAKLVLHLRPEYEGTPSLLGQYISYLQQEFGQTDPLLYDPSSNFARNGGAYFNDLNHGSRPFIGLGLSALYDLLQAKSLDEILHHTFLHHEEVHWQLSKAAWEHRFIPFEGWGRSSDYNALQLLVDSPSKGLVPFYVAGQEIAAYWVSLQDTLRELSSLIMEENKDWARIKYVLESGNHMMISLLYQYTGVLRLSNYAYHQLVAAEGNVIWSTEQQRLVLPVEHVFRNDPGQCPRKFEWLLNRELEKDLVPYLAFQQAALLDLSKQLQEFLQRWDMEAKTIYALIPLKKKFASTPRPKKVYQQCSFLLKKAAAKYPFPLIPEFQPGKSYPPPLSSREIDEFQTF